MATAAGVTLPGREAVAQQKFATLPRRTLGGTGEEVSVLAFGSGSRFMMYEEDDVALEALSLALDGGINYIDTAVSYGEGKSESRIGQLMPTRRIEIFLATKCRGSALPKRAGIPPHRGHGDVSLAQEGDWCMLLRKGKVENGNSG